MEIKIELSQAELDEMGVTKEALPDRIVEQLDEAVLPSGRASASWPGYWVTVTVKD
jgi:hypothetical protein